MGEHPSPHPHHFSPVPGKSRLLASLPPFLPASVHHSPGSLSNLQKVCTRASPTTPRTKPSLPPWPLGPSPGPWTALAASSLPLFFVWIPWHLSRLKLSPWYLRTFACTGTLPPKVFCGWLQPVTQTSAQSHRPRRAPQTPPREVPPPHIDSWALSCSRAAPTEACISCFFLSHWMVSPL